MNVSRLAFAALGLSLATACIPTEDKTSDDTEVSDDTSSTDGLQSGTYTLQLIGVEGNSCPYEFNIGQTQLLILDIGSNGLVATNGDGNDFEFDAAGEGSWSREASLIDGTYSPCMFRLDIEEEIEATANNAFTMRTDTREATEGDCSAYDVSDWPCSYILRYNAVLN